MIKWITGLFLIGLFEISFSPACRQNLRADKTDFTQPLQFDWISSEQGLSQNSINCIFQDSKGFLWFGTQDGLNKFDGYSFEIFKHHPLDSTTISHNWIWDINEDRAGNLWIATWRGLNKYDLNSSKFIRYLPEENNPNSINNSRPTSIKEDSDGNLWIGTWGGGISLYDPQNDTFISFIHDPGEIHGLSNNFIRTLSIDSRGDLWIGTWDGLCRINTNNLIKNNKTVFSRYHYDNKNPLSISGNKIVSIHEDQQGKIWVGTMESGLNRFDLNTSLFTRFSHDPQSDTSLSSDGISSIFEDSHGNLWIATIEGGLNHFISDTRGFIHYKHEVANDESLSSNKLLSLFEDKSGILWIGTLTSGLIKLDLSRKKFSYTRHSEADRNSLSGDLVRCFLKDGSGYLWIGTEESGLNRLDSRTGHFRHFRYNPKDPHSLSHDNIQALTADKKGNLWIGTFGGGVNRYNAKTHRFQHFKHNPRDDRSIASNYIEDLLLDSEGFLWIGTSDKGLDRYDTRSKKIKHYRFSANDSLSISSDYILSLYEDTRGKLWIGGWGGGLNEYDSETNTFIRYIHSPSNPSSLSDNIVNCISETTVNGIPRLWVGTSAGLSYTSLEDSSCGVFNHLFESHGLVNHHIYGMLEDKQGNLWLSTNGGISKYSPDGSFKNYDSGDGLPSDEFFGDAYYQSKTGELYFGCSKGFISFFPDSIKDNTYVPQIVVSSFKKFNKIVKLDKHISVMEELKLSYKDYVFSFDFSALDYTAPLKNQYAYKMEGFNEDWIYTDSRRRSATFTNMDPGEYVFKVKGSNSDGIWNEAGASIRIIISPPFWKTWWFRLLWVFLAGFIILIAHFYRVRHLKISQQNQIEFSNKLIESQEAERKRIAAELHDSLGQNLLIVNNELQQLKQQPKNVADNIDEVTSIVKDSINEVREISHNLHPHMLDRLGLTKAIEAMVNKMSHAADIQFDLKLDNIDQLLPKESEIHFYRIIQEATNNILKHADTDFSSVTIKKIANHIDIVIKDNGKGFHSGSKMKEGIGLTDMKERTRLMDGSFQISSRPGAGTTILINIPFSKEV
jgi:ligand-binding sensor domain-containing protein/signal transduction histidine kinase